jgi:hypothetical protein
MKFRTCLLAVAGIGLVLPSSLALAQQPPTPPADADAGAPPSAPADPNAPAAPPPGATAPTPPPSATAPAPPPPGDPAAPPTGTEAAQPPAATPEPAPPAAQPAPPPVQPAPTSSAPPPVQFGVTTGPTPDDTTAPDDGTTKGPKPLIWRGSTFTWNQAGTTTIFGIGRDNIGGEEEYYGWDFVLAPQIYLYDAPKDKISAFAEIGWNTELTNGPTVDERETLFKDMQLGARYSRNIWESGGAQKGEYATTGAATARFILPTSEASYTQGRYLVTALGLGAKQQIKVLGKKAVALNNVTVGVSGTWAHLFARSYQATDPALERDRQNASGQTIKSDVLATKSYDPDRVTLGATLELPIVQDLALATQFRLVGNFKHDFETGGGQTNCDVAIANEPCVVADRDENRVTYVPSTAFDIALTYPIYEVVGLTLGYNNENRWIGEDGQRRNIFYSPDAQFYLDITANLDVIYSKATRREKRKNATQWAKAEY